MTSWKSRTIEPEGKPYWIFRLYVKCDVCKATVGHVSVASKKDDSSPSISHSGLGANRKIICEKCFKLFERVRELL